MSDRACDKTEQAAIQESIPDKAKGENTWFVYRGQTIFLKSAKLIKGTNMPSLPTA